MRRWRFFVRGKTVALHKTLTPQGFALRTFKQTPKNLSLSVFQSPYERRSRRLRYAVQTNPMTSNPAIKLATPGQPNAVQKCPPYDPIRLDPR